MKPLPIDDVLPALCAALRERHGVRLAPATPEADAAPAVLAPLTIQPAMSPS